METRAFQTELVVERQKKGKGDKDDYEGKIGGRAAPFGEFTRLGDYSGVRVLERFAATAFEFSERGVRYLIGHDASRPVASREAGTLALEQREDGLYTEVRLDLRDPDAMRAMVKTERRDFGGQSVGFVPLDEEREEVREAGELVEVRYTVKRAELREVSLVTWPAYSGGQTSIEARGYGQSRVDEIERLLQDGAGDIPPQRRARIARARHMLTMGRRRPVGRRRH